MPEEEGRATQQDERARRHQNDHVRNNRQRCHNSESSRAVSRASTFDGTCTFLLVTFAGLYLAAHVSAAAIGWQATTFALAALVWVLVAGSLYCQVKGGLMSELDYTGNARTYERRRLACLEWAEAAEAHGDAGVAEEWRTFAAAAERARDRAVREQGRSAVNRTLTYRRRYGTH